MADALVSSKYRGFTRTRYDGTSSRSVVSLAATSIKALGPSRMGTMNQQSKEEPSAFFGPFAFGMPLGQIVACERVERVGPSKAPPKSNMLLPPKGPSSGAQLCGCSSSMSSCPGSSATASTQPLLASRYTRSRLPAGKLRRTKAALTMLTVVSPSRASLICTSYAGTIPVELPNTVADTHHSSLMEKTSHGSPSCNGKRRNSKVMPRRRCPDPRTETEYIGFPVFFEISAQTSPYNHMEFDFE
eukprot:CAMPEP_0115718406 /NCGR_PEP_ID=MMETSP0272-20121206/77404_1 /TAXON_ID=71861 /ORGANISM="Scrippsiella trochoidea, Strain CCMP3099" /LENGTH=243 /DNA_ID=CAMNT_0003160913 /DNA_START=173 /DNA_END=904 /DNA_ORIENTATION=-